MGKYLVPIIRFIAQSRLPTQYGQFTIHAFEEVDTGREHVALTMGNVTNGSHEKPILSRIHSECLTGDALFSMRCDCGAQLQAALEKISITKQGALIYLRQEGRGIGLLNKVRAYQLQDQGRDTVEANEELGFAPDMRCYDVCKQIFNHLDIQYIQLMTNNPKKVDALAQLGIKVVARVPHDVGKNQHNAQYIATKVGKMGHFCNLSKIH